ncbi:MAG: hypothetical protein K1X64_12460 [Myxococcaceae bacterium]|nr:hypothetical protein [Myxococcaceae bacterium]
MDSKTLLSRLNDPSENAPLSQLARRAVDAWLNAPVSGWLNETQLAQLLRSGLEGWLSTPAAMGALTAWVEGAVNRLKSDTRPLNEALPEQWVAAVREVVERPISPDRQWVLTVLQQPALRELIRTLLLQVVLDVGRKWSAPVAGVAKGLGSLAKMALETTKSRTGGLGTLVGAVSGEVERQLETRSIEFVDVALAKVVDQLADVLSNPRRAGEAAALRGAILDGALQLEGPQLARELMNADVAGGAEIVRQGLRAWLQTPRADDDLLYAARFLLGANGQRPVRALFDELGLTETALTHAPPFLAQQMRTVVAHPGFAPWLDALLAPTP